MGTLFLFGSVLFWVIISLTLLVILITTEIEESNSWGGFILILTFCALYFGGNSNEINSLLKSISQNPETLFLCFFGYILIGVIWSFVKWYFYLISLKENLTTQKWENVYISQKDKFNAKYNKERIVNWMLYWPISALWTLVNQPLRKLFNRIYVGVEKQFQKISDKVTNDLKK